ncbi:hypothetical protein [Paraburkholderia rhynchosiae]|uniref:Amino acid ABC transporter substrate-binding protein n=1 Tax=Paraburkholderia rhynchosiae TaxID=487049 RepID=A0A2N7WMS5_9BURK|nr:hypothetical protein [Paraburkholderia rhynchosiae]PMS30723.1 hypothetical protein C0Z16_14345 [Paraburkholderia rhynchosiae]CAB3687252.1 hypothetical protein LMG27174_02977 [Paraburkholderia rhynchosiae]
MQRRSFVLAALGAAGMLRRAHAVSIADFHIVHPRIRPGAEVHAAFALAVLDVAMKAANATYSIRQADVAMERGRALAELADGGSINLLWTSMDSRAESGLNVVPIPVNRGLIGYRVFVIRKDRQAEFDRVGNLADLRRLTAGQGLGWVDTDILVDAGLKVDTSTTETLFAMTRAGRIDYYPRGVIEAFPELEARSQTEPDLTVEKRLLLKYRSDFLFYVARHSPALAGTIERGFTAAYKNGSYMRLFNSHPYIQQALVQANLRERKVIELDNPYLSAADRKIPEKYWEQWPIVAHDRTA